MGPTPKGRKRILVAADDLLRTGVINEPELSIIQDLGEVEFETPTTEDRMLSLARDVDAILLGGTRVGRRVILASRRLAIIARAGSGYEKVDLATATECGVLVTNVPAVSANAVAEHAVMLMLAVSRRLETYGALAKSDGWEKVLGMGVSGVNRELAGLTLGIIGFGSVGSVVARKAIGGLGMKVLAFDHSPGKIKKAGLQPATLSRVLQGSDVVTIHLPLNQATEGMIGKPQLAMMKESAILINTSRGKIVDEKELYTRLKDGRLFGAGLDVLSQEPPPKGSSLLGLSNVIVTPHIASHTTNVILETWDACVDAIRQVMEGHLPRSPANIVNKEVVDLYLHNVKRNRRARIQ